MTAILAGAATMTALAATSEIRVASIVPENYTTIEVNEDGTANFRISFTGPATLTSCEIFNMLQGVKKFPHEPAPGATVETVGERVYADSWDVTFTKEYVELKMTDIEYKLDCHITAEDKDGNDIKYPYLGEDQWLIAINYSIGMEGGPGVDFTANIPEVAYNGKFDSFTVTQPEGYESIGSGAQMWDDELNQNVDITDQITITSPGGFEAHATSIRGNRVTFAPAITESGSYSIYFPWHEFSIMGKGDGGELGSPGGYEGQAFFWSREKTIDFEIIIEEGEDPNGPGDDQPDVPSFELPEATVALSTDESVTVTWDCYILQELEPEIIAKVTLPDGTVKEVFAEKRGIDGEELGYENAPDQKTNNALFFTDYLPFEIITVDYEDIVVPIPQYGEFKIEIPAGVVSVNRMIPNEAVTLTWTVEKPEDDQPEQPGDEEYAPQGKLVVPAGGTTETFYGMVTIVWGFETIEDNMGDLPMSATITYPDGTSKVVKGTITDSNGGELGYPDAAGKPYLHNGLMFVNLLPVEEVDGLTQSVQQYGEYRIEIPAGTVLVNVEGDTWLPNPEGTFTWTVTGGSQSGIGAVEADGGAVYYDLQGRRIANPDKGIYIKVQNGSASKVKN